MFAVKIPVLAKKAVALSIAILFTLNSISFARPVTRDTLRETSAALVISSEIGSLLNNSLKTGPYNAKAASAGITVRTITPEPGADADTLKLLGLYEKIQSSPGNDEWMRAEALAELSSISGQDAAAPYIDETVSFLTGYIEENLIKANKPTWSDHLGNLRAIDLLLKLGSKDIFRRYQYIMVFLRDRLVSHHNVIAVKTASVLSKFEKDELYSYEIDLNQLLSVFNSSLEDPSLAIRTESVKGLLRLKTAIAEQDIEEAIDSLTGDEGLNSVDPLIREYSEKAFQLIGSKYFPEAFYVSIRYTGLEDFTKIPVAIFAKDIHDFIEQLDKRFLELGISSKGLEYIPEPNDLNAISPKETGVFENALLSIVGSKLEAMDAHTKTFETMLELDVITPQTGANAGALKLLSLYEEIQSSPGNDEWMRAEALAELSSISGQDAVVPYIDEIASFLARYANMEIINDTGNVALFSRDNIMKRLYAIELLLRLDLKENTFNELLIKEFLGECINVHSDKLVIVKAASLLSEFEEVDLKQLFSILNSSLEEPSLAVRTESVKGLLKINTTTVKRNLKKLIDNLAGKEGLDSIDPLIRQYSEKAFQLIGSKYFPEAFYVSIKRTGLEDNVNMPAAIFAKNTKELEDKLKDSMAFLGIACRKTGDGNLNFTLNGKDFVVNPRDQKALKDVLFKLFAYSMSAESYARASSTGISADEEQKFRTIKDTLDEDDVVSPSKASAAGISVKVSRVPEMSLQISANKEYRDMLRIHQKNLHGPGADYRLFSAMQLALFSSIDKILREDYRDSLLYECRLALKSEGADRYKRLLAATGLAYLAKLDSAIMSKYAETVFFILEEGLNSGISHYRLLSAIGIAGLADAYKYTPAGYKDKALSIIEAAMKSSDPNNSPLAKTAFAVINDRRGDICKVSVDYKGIEEPVVIFAGYNRPDELMDKLDKRVLGRLGISCTVLEDGRLRFSTTIRKRRLQRTSDMAQEDKLESALMSLVANKLYFSSPVSAAAKTSPSGLTDSHAKDAEWVTEKSKNATLALQAFDKIIADKFKDIKPSATIILNQDDIPPNQRMFLMLLAKSNPFRQELIKRLGVNVVLSNEFDASKDRTEHMLIVSRSFIKIDGAEDAHYLNLQSEINDEDAFMHIPSALVFAKGLILFSITNSPDIEAELKTFYKRLTSGKNPWNCKMLYDFVKPRGRFVLLLPKAKPVDRDYFDNLQKISMQTFVAA